MFRSDLTSISPLDGRYHDKVSALSPIFSEHALIKFRVMVEIRWLEMLAESNKIPALPPFDEDAKKILANIIQRFSESDAALVKEIESKTNHDVKAIEYFIKKSIGDNEKLASIIEFVHFGCTSEDINNLSYGLMLKQAHEECIMPVFAKLVGLLKDYAHQHADIAMLGHTHGQPATPTTVGKEIANFINRLQNQIQLLDKTAVRGKLNGATGNYNALAIACPDVDWEAVSREFVNRLGLKWNDYTTQIEPHDDMVVYFEIMHNINTILMDFDRNIWTYISMDYFKLKLKEGEVGSSTMPHKINPIDFENSEGNLGLANAFFNHMSDKLPISRMQRDLSDSTVLRNIGVAFGHSLLAYQSTMNGIKKLEVNREKLFKDLDDHWEVLAEPVQTVMRLHKIPESYEKLKFFSQGKKMDQEKMQKFISELPLPQEDKRLLLGLTPHNYTGYAERLAKRI